MAKKNNIDDQPVVASVALDLKELGRNLTGFHQEWISADGDDGSSYELSTGVGLGNPYGQFRAKDKSGKSVTLFFDARQLFHALVKVADAELSRS